MLELVLVIEDEDIADDEDSSDEEIEVLDVDIADDEDVSDEKIEVLDEGIIDDELVELDVAAFVYVVLKCEEKDRFTLRLSAGCWK